MIRLTFQLVILVAALLQLRLGLALPVDKAQEQASDDKDCPWPPPCYEDAWGVDYEDITIPPSTTMAPTKGCLTCD